MAPPTAPANYNYLPYPADRVATDAAPGLPYYPILNSASWMMGGRTTPEPVADPTYSKATESFGALSHVDTVHSVFLNAKRGIEDLREDLSEDLTHPSDAAEDSLKTRIETYVGTYTSAAEQTRYFRRFLTVTTTETPPAETFVIGDLDAVVDPGRTRSVQTIDRDSGETVVQYFEENAGTALFGAGRVMVKNIRTVDALRYGLSMIRRRRQRRLATRRKALVDLEARIPKERDDLAAYNRARIEKLGDYAVAQHLVAENWAAVEQAFEDRRRVLENNLGLYYVRVRETPLSATLPDPLGLRYSAADDIVPGCPLEAVDLPDDLAPFMEAVLDVPVGDWAALRPLSHLLPGRSRLDTLVKRRRRDLDRRRTYGTGSSGSSLANRLAPLRRQNAALVKELLAKPFGATGSLLQVQRQGRDLLSLEDLLSGPPHRLRKRAQRLHGRLDAAAGCLLERLRTVRPSLRLDWASAAEDDRLAVEHPERWPGLEQAEAADFNGVRTLVELVAWWFRQLDAEASGGSRTALRNFLRAALLFAAQDDPEQVLRGSLETAPPRFLPGAILRLALNREALPGTALQLLDATQRVVGIVRIDDHDDQGALASVTKVLDASAIPDTSYSVTGVVKTLWL